MKIIPLSEARKTLASLKDDYLAYSEMAPTEREFLTALIKKYKPKKVVELGIAAGSSSVVLLNALRDLPNNKLISLDYSTPYHYDHSKHSGFIVDQYPELKKNWTLYSGGLVSEFTDKIGDGIDFCFIDTMHLVPGEIIDFLAILPFLKENAVVVFHDTNLHTWGISDWSLVNNLLISAISGEKLIPETHDKVFYHNALKRDIAMPFSNIAGVVLDSNQKDRVWDIFNILTQKWRYLPTQDDLNSFRRTLKKYYEPHYLDFFNDVAAYQESNYVPFVPPTPVEEVVAEIPPVETAKIDRPKLKRRYRRYNILSKIALGSWREKYKTKSLGLREQLKGR